MKKSRFSQEQVVRILREAQGGMGVKALCAKPNISEPAYCKWKQKLGCLDLPPHNLGQERIEVKWFRMRDNMDPPAIDSTHRATS